MDQVYGEAWWTSMFKARCQDHEPGLRLGLGICKVVVAGYWFVETEGASPRLGRLCNSVAGLQ